MIANQDFEFAQQLMKKFVLTILFTLFLSGGASADVIHFICKPLKLEGQLPPSFDPELSIDLENKYIHNHYGSIIIYYIGERKIKAKDSFAVYEFDRVSGIYSEKMFIMDGASEFRFQCEKAEPKI